MPLAGLLPAQCGTRHDFGACLAGMPLLRSGAVHRLQTALWLPNHHHPGWELHYVHRGSLDVELPGRRPRRLVASGGWFMLTGPGRVHRARDGIMPPVHLVWIQLDPGCADATRATPFDDAGLTELARLLHRRRDTAWRAPAGTAALFRRLAALAARPAAPLRNAVLRAGLVELLVLAAEPAPARDPPPRLARALAALGSEPPTTVTAAARTAGMAPGTLHALCAEHLGTTPAAWLLARRLDRARALLAAGGEVAATAHLLGFSSPRYFAHVFRREVGVPPSRYATASALAASEPPLAW